MIKKQFLKLGIIAPTFLSIFFMVSCSNKNINKNGVKNIEDAKNFFKKNNVFFYDSRDNGIINSKIYLREFIEKSNYESKKNIYWYFIEINESSYQPYTNKSFWEEVDYKNKESKPSYNKIEHYEVKNNPNVSDIFFIYKYKDKYFIKSYGFENESLFSVLK